MERKWYCPQCEKWQSQPRTWENEEDVQESDGDDNPNYRCDKCLEDELDIIDQAYRMGWDLPLPNKRKW